MTEHTARGPDWPHENGDAGECARFVGITPPAWKELWKLGLIPEPSSRQAAKWHWTVALAVSLNLPAVLATVAKLRRAEAEEGRVTQRETRRNSRGTPGNSPETQG